MKCWTSILGVITLALITGAAPIGTQELVDFIRPLETNQEEAKSIGLHKLSASEKANLNRLLNVTYLLGYQAGQKAGIDSLQNPTGFPPISQSAQKAPLGQPNTKAYKTKIEDDEGDILKLENGGIVEIISGYLGYVGYRKTAILFKSGSIWKIWIEGKRVYRCDVLREPVTGASIPFESVIISEVKGDGAIIVLLDGRVYKVDSIDTIHTALWLSPVDGLLLNGYELINLDQADEVVTVTKLR